MTRYAYLLPAGLLIGIVLVLPMIDCVLLSFRGEGAGNYTAIVRDEALHRSLVNTALFAVISVTIEMVLGLLFALLLHRSFAMRGLARAAVLVPWALPTAVMAMSWVWIFNDSFGIANDLLRRLGLLKAGVAWLGEAGTAMGALIFADVWKTTPFVAIIVLAGLQTIPRDLYEAMNIDGAGAWRRFRLVTLPLLRPAITLALVFRFIHALGIFELPRVMTGGGPADATRTLALHIYDVAMRHGRLEYGAALTLTCGVSFFLLALGATALSRGRAEA